MTRSGYVFSRTSLSLPLQRSPRKQRLIIGCSEKVAFSSEVLQADVRFYTCMHVTEKNNHATYNRVKKYRYYTPSCDSLILFVCLFFLFHSGKGKEKAKKQQKVNMICCTCSCLLFVCFFPFFVRFH